MNIFNRKRQNQKISKSAKKRKIELVKKKKKEKKPTKKIKPKKKIRDVGPTIAFTKLEQPIIFPRRENGWESWQTFNPGVILLDNKVHILYRAIGQDGFSRFGYALSSDGFHIDERLPYPVYQHESKTRIFSSLPQLFNIYSYLSGGGWGGAEDPRLTLIDKRIYMLYVAIESDLPQLTITSISKSDFLNRTWNWDPAKNISPPGVITKSGVLFPEKIKDKYVIFYRIFPDIWLDLLDNLDFPNGKYLNGQPCIKIRKNYWDSLKIGAGAPPIKTKYGWLLIYYGVDERDVSKYKIGAMLLDLENPCRVLVRPPYPLLEPSEWYEEEGYKPGITYPCGAVVKDNKLLIYYGGADNYVSVAWADFGEFLEGLRKESKPKMRKSKLLEKK